MYKCTISRPTQHLGHIRASAPHVAAHSSADAATSAPAIGSLLGDSRGNGSVVQPMHTGQPRLPATSQPQSRQR
eukprot:13991603-Alexandrium_andersonii.AAC.1